MTIDEFTEKWGTDTPSLLIQRAIGHIELHNPQLAEGLADLERDLQSLLREELARRWNR